MSDYRSTIISVQWLYKLHQIVVVYKSEVKFYWKDRESLPVSLCISLLLLASTARINR